MTRISRHKTVPGHLMPAQMSQTYTFNNKALVGKETESNENVDTKVVLET